MKCPMCNGEGSIPYHIADDMFDENVCPMCNGTGKIEQTNEEWLRQANTEQLAEFLACVEARQNADYNEETKAWVEWLKQPHKE